MKEDKRRFLVSLRPSDVRLCARPLGGGLEGEGGEERRKQLGERLERYLSEREKVMSNPARVLSPGQLISGKVCVLQKKYSGTNHPQMSQVCSVEERDVLLELEGEMVGKANTHTAHGILYMYVMCESHDVTTCYDAICKLTCLCRCGGGSRT